MNTLKTLLIALFLACCFSVQAQDKDESESAKPSFGVTVWRECYSLEIDGRNYYDATIEIKAKKNYNIGVTILVTDYQGEKIYKKKFSKSYLYVFSDKSVQVGKGNATTQAWVWKSEYDGEWKAIIRERGIY